MRLRFLALSASIILCTVHYLPAASLSTFARSDIIANGDRRNCTDMGTSDSSCVSSLDVFTAIPGLPPDIITIQGTAVATANYGSVQASANVDLMQTCCSDSLRTSGFADARAGFSDALTILAPVASGTMFFRWSKGQNSFFMSTLGALWTNGIPVPINAFLMVQAEAGFGSPQGMPSSFSFEADLLSVSVLDGNYNPITGFTYITDSGAAYPVQGGILVTEPSAAWLMAFGVSTLTTLCKKSRRGLPTEHPLAGVPGAPPRSSGGS